jgi:signal peptidase II
MRRWRKLLLVLLTIVACVGCDQSTKAVARLHLAERPALSFAGGTLRLQYAENKGAFLSLGSSLPEGARLAIFIGGVAAVLAALLLCAVGARNSTTVVALSLICAGGLSNLLDRIAYGGYVIDFINLGIGRLRTGVFNVADLAISIGILLLMLHGLRHRRR